MANVTTELKVVVRSVGKGEIDKLSKALNDLGSKALKPVDQKLKSSVAELKQLSSQSTQTKNNIKGFSSAFKELANNLEIGSKEFKEATAEAKKLDAQLEKLEGRKPGRGGRLRGAAQTAGAIAAGGVFGGPEGALGAAIGGIVGGPAGAAVGAALGAQVGALRQAAGAAAEYSANIGKLRIALQGVTTSQEEYTEGLEFIKKTTKDFAIPQEVITRQFTKLQASVQGAGGNLEDTKTAFNGIVAAVRATGGSLQDVDAALTATAQVFSKGKVSAEELRQQIGERLPGAFTLFAESIGLTPQELDKALEDGKVSLQDFQKFAKAIFDRYGENAKTIASSPKSAGDRLKGALEELNESLGTLLEPIGAAFQKTFESIVKAINAGIIALNNFLGIGTKGAVNKARRELDSALKGFERFLGVDEDSLGKREKLAYQRSRRRVQLALSRLEEAQDAARPADIVRPDQGSGLSGIIDKPSGDKATSTLSKQKTLSAELLALEQQRFNAFQSNQRIQFAELELRIDQQRIAEQFNAGEISFNAAKKLDLKAQEGFIKNILKLREQEKEALRDAGKGQKDLNKELTDTQKLYKQLGDSIKQNFGSAIEGLVFSTKSLAESLNDLLKSIANIFIQFGLNQAFTALGNEGGFLGELFGNAKGNVIAENKIVPFAYGGVVNKPTLFPMANGTGLMGEAGPEAIVPLTRGPSGKLGIEAYGASSGDIIVNVDASGSSVEGEAEQSKLLGKAIGAAVQAEIVKQKMPGGLLS